MDDLRSTFRQAAEIAAEVPEPMQGAAFLRAFDVLTKNRDIATTESAADPDAEREPVRKKHRQRRGGSVPTKEAASRRRSSGRAGPKAALRDLANTPFLNDARSISEIQKHLEFKKALKFELHNLSSPLGALVREGVLEREQNEKGKYVYKTTGG